MNNQEKIDRIEKFAEFMKLSIQNFGYIAHIDTVFECLKDISDGTYDKKHDLKGKVEEI